MKASLLSLVCLVLAAAPLRAQQPRPSPSPKTKATPTYSDEDLDRKAGRTPVALGDKASTAEASTPPSEQPAEPEVRRFNEVETPVPEDTPVRRVDEVGEGGGAGWAERAQAMRDAAAAADTRVQELDSQAQELLWKYLQSTDTNEILGLKAEQQEILDQIPEAKKAADEARKALEDFEREAARAGVSPGELREKKKP